MMTPQPSLATLVGDLLASIGQLVRQEFLLARAEISENISRAKRGVIALGIAILAGFCALLILLQAAVMALSITLAPWLAAVVVGAATALVAAVLLKSALQNLRAENLVPHRTIRSIQTGKTLTTEKIG